jgi:hypothetical protein
MHSDYESTPGVQASRVGSASATRLHGRWLVLVWIMLGGAAVFALFVFIASLQVYYLQLHTICRAASCAVG